jgi:hypothetical protein
VLQAAHWKVHTPSARPHRCHVLHRKALRHLVVLARLPQLCASVVRLQRPQLSGYVLWIDLLTAPVSVDVLPTAAAIKRLGEHAKKQLPL